MKIKTVEQARAVLAGLTAQAGDFAWFTTKGHKYGAMTSSAALRASKRDGGVTLHGYNAEGVHRVTIGRNGSVRWL